MSSLLAHHPEDLKLHHPVITAAKAALEHISLQLLPAGEQKVQHGTVPCWLLNHLYKEVAIDTFKKP